VYELVFKIHKNSPTIIYNLKKFFPGLYPGPPFKGEGKGREKRGGRGKRGGKRREGFWEGQSPQGHFSGYGPGNFFSDNLGSAGCCQPVEMIIGNDTASCR
jgi:hypothetical protein